MRKALHKLCLMLIFSLALSCSDEDTSEAVLIDTPLVVHDIEVKYYMTCGWGLRADSLSLSPDEVRLIQNIRSFSNSSRDTTIDTSFIPSLAWLDSLYSNIDMPTFKALSHNQGNLAVDGCDLVLDIRKDQSQHQIMFGLNDSLPTIEGFMHQIDSLWSLIGVHPPYGSH